MKIVLDNLVNNAVVKGDLAVDSCAVKMARNNKEYLDLILSDGVRTIVCKKWDHSGDAPKVGTVISIVATVGEYLGVSQLGVQSWKNAVDVEFNDFIRHSPISDEELLDTIDKYISIIQDPDYSAVVRHIYAKYRQPILMAPAAMGHHHVYIGGLIEHNIGVTKNAITMADERTDLNLLIAGALVHDIGKIYTYALDGMAFVLTDEGKLLDHIVIGNSILTEAAQVVNTPQDKLVLLKHIVASHHGKLEWGSPIVPKFKEALMIHYADMADVTAFKMASISDKALEDAKWSTYERSLGTEVLIQRDKEYSIDVFTFGGDDID